MIRPSPSAPAWYRDPDDPARLRHWNGQTWDGRKRAAPEWSNGTSELVAPADGRRRGDPVLDGPVHPTALLATASAGRSTGMRRNLLTHGHPSGPRRPGGTGAAAPSGHGATRPPLRSSWPRSRVVMMTISAVIGLSVLVLVATIGIGPARTTTATTTLAENTAFIRAANMACGESMGAIRLAPAAAMSAGATAATVSATAVAAANADLTRLAGRIRGLPLDAAPRALVSGWLVSWSSFATARQRWADEASRSPSASTATGTSQAGSALLTAVDLAADAADGFATTNGLDNCTLTPGRTPVTAT